MFVTRVERAQFSLLVVKVACSGEAVRQGWKELYQRLDPDSMQRLTAASYGYVLVPEWQWESGVRDLWVGIKAWPEMTAPEGTAVIDIPERQYAKIRVHGDRRKMEEAYEELNRWFMQSELERDTSISSYSIEANALFPVNPFDIPAHVISYFQYDIYAPIKPN